MKRRIGYTLAALVLGFMQSQTFAAAAGANGLWKTIDDVTGKPKALIQIAEAPDHSLQGTVIKIFPRPGMISMNYARRVKENCIISVS